MHQADDQRLIQGATTHVGTDGGPDLRTVSITQPSGFPWLGMFLKLHRSDIHFVLDDVKFQKDGFLNRLKLKAPVGPRFATIPLDRGSTKGAIHAVRPLHPVRSADVLARFTDWYRGAPFVTLCVELLRQYLDHVREHGFVEAAIRSMTTAMDLMQLTMPATVRSSRHDVGLSATERLLHLTKTVGGTAYLYGEGTQRLHNDYLDTALLISNGVQPIRLHYPDWRYAQLHGRFCPRLSVLDAFANLGPERTSRLIDGIHAGPE